MPYKRQPRLMEVLFGGFDNWDSQYYIYIAEHGYRYEELYDNMYEQRYAFFPLYPLLIRSVGSLLFLTPLGSFIPYWSILVISGVIISNAAFVLSAGLLYQLTLEMSSTNGPISESMSSTKAPMSSTNGPISQPMSSTNGPISQPMSSTNGPMSQPMSSTNAPMSQSIAALTVLFYTLNPASVFMSSVYTESLFACLSFAGMLAVKRTHLFTAAVLFGLASATRSNGIVLSGFIIYHHLIYLYQLPQRTYIKVVIQTFKMSLQVLIVWLPFIGFQMYSYYQFCIHGSMYLQKPSVCHWVVPIPYSYLQQTYWNVGFLRMGSYEWNQRHYFALASPMTVLSLTCIFMYFITGGRAKAIIKWAVNNLTFYRSKIEL